MHSSVYLYWGWYWRNVYREIPLIVAQIAFLYALDMLVVWWREDKRDLGFGPVPIVLSTNLFLWFRDDWFYLQFLMVAVGLLVKEFIRWKREGHSAHIFNPSAFPLSVFSIGLLLTGTTGITWGQEISTSLHLPPNIYVEIFVLGLIVQALFSVTLVTLSAAASLLVLNVIYTGSTGMYHFIDSYIPVAVFLGLHLLVTDPATSPRRTSAKIVFGTAYGCFVFGLYGFLGWLGLPQFYDKLLCVPVLNLSVRALDRWAVPLESALARISERIGLLRRYWALSPRQANYSYMAIWVALGVPLLFSGVLGGTHPGSDTNFWREACESGKARGCTVWARTLKTRCSRNQGDACLELGEARAQGTLVGKDAVEAGTSFGRACDLHVEEGCVRLVNFIQSGGDKVMNDACNAGDGPSCFILGSLAHKGDGVTADDSRALEWFRKSCDSKFARGCSRLGESYLFGEGSPREPMLAQDSFEKACQGEYGPACVNVALMYRQGEAGLRDEALAHRRLEEACELGVERACAWIRTPATASAAAAAVP